MTNAFIIRNFSLPLSILLTVFSATIGLAEPSQFEKVRKLKGKFLPTENTIEVSWKRVPNAKRYLVQVVDAEGTVVFKKRTTKRKKQFDAGSLLLNGNYNLKARVLGHGGKRASKIKSKKYTFKTQIPTKAVKGTLNATNSAGRSGSYYLPKNFTLRALPVLVAYHGQGGDGLSMVNLFRKLADSKGFIIIAPSSRISPDGIVSWEVSDVPGVGTDDYAHTLDCINEILAIPHVTPTEFLATGVSAGGSSAAFLATNDSRFSSMAILHGGIFERGFGENVVRSWFSTGTTDTLRTPEELKEHAAVVRSLGFPDVTYMEYDLGHVVKTEEQEDVINWWLGE